MVIPWLLGASTWASLLGCSSLWGPDPARIAALERELAEAEPSAAVELLIRGSVEAGSVRFGCATSLGDLAGTEPLQREELLDRAFGDWTALCPTPCAQDLPPGERPERIAAALAQCDRAGLDPVFGGPLAGLRPSMAPMSYLAVRTLAEVADDTSPTFASVHPELAIGLALEGAPAGGLPGPDLTVQASRDVASGSLDDLRTAIRACGPDAVVSHRLVVDPEGRVVGVAGPPEPCVSAALAALALPADGRYAVLDLSWKPPPERARPGPRRAVIDGPIASEVVEGVVRAYAGQIRYCYERQLARRPSLAGDVVVRFGIAPTGRVSGTETVSNTSGSAPLAECVERVVGGWRFPRIPGPATVTWPTHFAPG